MIKQSVNYFMDCFSEIINEYETITQRYILRHKLGKNLPFKRIEEGYLEEYKKRR